MSRRNLRAMRRFDREHFCWLEGDAYTFVGATGGGRIAASRIETATAAETEGLSPKGESLTRVSGGRPNSTAQIQTED